MKIKIENEWNAHVRAPFRAAKSARDARVRTMFTQPVIVYERAERRPDLF